MNYDGKDNLSLKVLWRSAVDMGEVMIVGLVLYSWPRVLQDLCYEGDNEVPWQM